MVQQSRGFDVARGRRTTPWASPTWNHLQAVPFVLHLMSGGGGGVDPKTQRNTNKENKTRRKKNEMKMARKGRTNTKKNQILKKLEMDKCQMQSVEQLEKTNGLTPSVGYTCIRMMMNTCESLHAIHWKT